MYNIQKNLNIISEYAKRNSAWNCAIIDKE